MSDQEVQFTIKSFSIDHFSYTKPKHHVRKDRINFGIQHHIEPYPDTNEVHIGFRIKVEQGTKNPIAIATIETNSVYFVQSKKESLFTQFPEDLLVTFFSIAYSSTRGALTAKAQGSIIEDVPLPLIDPVEIVQNDLKSRESEAKASA
jgi:hypothetical protein